MNNQSLLNDDRIGRLILKLSIPAFFGMAVTALYNVVNTIFIGHYVGALGIAGPSLVFPIQMLAMGMSMMMGMGGASLISRTIGAGDKPKAELALGNALAGILAISFLIMIIGLANRDFWLVLVGASPDTLPYARDYLSVILSGLFLQTSAMCLGSLVMAEGNARVVMIGQIIGAVSNIILDAVFIIGLHCGVKGAALGTIIAQMFSAGYFLWFYLSGKSYLKLLIKNFAFKWSILREITSIGVATLGETLTVSLSFVIVNRMLIAYGGDYTISAFGINDRLLMFVMMPGMAVGQSLQPVLGFNYGIKNFGRALRSIKIAITVSSVVSVLAFLILYFVPEIFVRIFTTDTQLIDITVHAAKFIFLTLPLVGFIMVGCVIFQAVGKAKQAFISAMSRSCFFLLPLVLILPHFLKLDGVWLAFPVTDVLAALMIIVLLIPLLKEFRREENSARKAGLNIEVVTD